MLETLKFVQGAVARKDFVPTLTHFHIGGGRIMGFNGSISLSSPIDLDLDCNPKARSFIKAIQTCRETVRLHLTANKRLCVQSGSFTAYVECTDEKFPEVGPEGDEVKVNGEALMDCLKTLEPFISEDASRPWSRGILLRGESAFATNNVILVEKWLGGANFPELNIPAESVAELVRIGQPPTRTQVGKGCLTFHYQDRRWLRSQLLSTEWPDISAILNREGAPKPVPEGFFRALEDIAPFLGDLERCYLQEGRVATEEAEGSGASVLVAGLPSSGCFNLKQLLKLESIISSIDFESFPQPSMFYGKHLRGAIAGMM